MNVVEQLIIEMKNRTRCFPNLGGQTGLNLAMELAERGFLKEHQCRIDWYDHRRQIKKAEDRQEFKDTMEKIGEPVACISSMTTSVEAGIEFAKEIGYPVDTVVRHYTLGGTGGGYRL